MKCFNCFVRIFIFIHADLDSNSNSEQAGHNRTYHHYNAIYQSGFLMSFLNKPYALKTAVCICEHNIFVYYHECSKLVTIKTKYTTQLVIRQYCSSSNLEIFSWQSLPTNRQLGKEKVSQYWIGLDAIANIALASFSIHF